MAKRKSAGLYTKSHPQNTRIVIYAMLAFMAFLTLLVMISLNAIQKEQAQTLNSEAAENRCPARVIYGRGSGCYFGEETGPKVICGNGSTKRYLPLSNRHCAQINGLCAPRSDWDKCAAQVCNCVQPTRRPPEPPPGRYVTPTPTPYRDIILECVRCSTNSQCGRGGKCISTSEGRCCQGTTIGNQCSGVRDCTKMRTGCPGRQLCDLTTKCCKPDDVNR